MNRRYAVYLGLIALLIAINAGRLWLHSGKGVEESSVRSKVFLPEDFRLRVDVPDSGGGMGRNLFQSQDGAPRVTNAHIARKAPVKAVEQAPVPSAQVEMDTGLSKFRLLGVVLHAGKMQAYLAINKESVIASAGDKVFGQFAVDKITVDEVELRDLQNNTTRRIPLSGK